MAPAQKSGPFARSLRTMSTFAKSQPSARRRFDLRSFLAGGMATAALIAAAIVLFGSLAAYVAFNGLPSADEADAPGTQVVVSSGSKAPEAAAARLGRAPAAVAATPARGSTAASPAAAADGATGAGTSGGGTAATTPSTDTTDTTVGPASSSRGTDSSSASGGAGQAVDNVQDSTGNVAPLSDLTDPITEPLDQTVTDGLNQVGGAVGNPELGSQVDGTLGQLSDGLLGGN